MESKPACNAKLLLALRVRGETDSHEHCVPPSAGPMAGAFPPARARCCSGQTRQGAVGAAGTVHTCSTPDPPLDWCIPVPCLRRRHPPMSLGVTHRLQGQDTVAHPMSLLGGMSRGAGPPAVCMGFIPPSLSCFRGLGQVHSCLASASTGLHGCGKRKPGRSPEQKPACIPPCQGLDAAMPLLCSSGCLTLLLGWPRGSGAFGALQPQGTPRSPIQQLRGACICSHRGNPSDSTPAGCCPPCHCCPSSPGWMPCMPTPVSRLARVGACPLLQGQSRSGRQVQMHPQTCPVVGGGAHTMHRAGRAPALATSSKSPPGVMG